MPTKKKKVAGKREPQPFFREFNQTWYLQLGKRQIKLGKDKDAAWEEYHRLMEKRKKVEKTANMTVCAVLDLFLDWVKDWRSDGTYRWYTEHLNNFARHIGEQLNPRGWIAANGGLGLSPPTGTRRIRSIRQKPHRVCFVDQHNEQAAGAEHPISCDSAHTRCPCAHYRLGILVITPGTAVPSRAKPAPAGAARKPGGSCNVRDARHTPYKQAEMKTGRTRHRSTG